MRWTTVSANTEPEFHWLGRRPYVATWRRLMARAADVAAGRRAEIVWACEHDPVYTTGRRGVDNRRHAALAAPLIRTDRGGETTFHGPGQVMLYPVVSLRARGLTLRAYVHLLEQSCIECLDALGAGVTRRQGLPGVWAPAGKVAAIGLRVRRGVAYHGMALNVAVDPCWFDAIDACGTGLPSVSLASLVARVPPPRSLARRWADCFCRLL